MNEPATHTTRERLEALVGDWTMQAGPPDGPLRPGAAQVSASPSPSGSPAHSPKTD